VGGWGGWGVVFEVPAGCVYFSFAGAGGALWVSWLRNGGIQLPCHSPSTPPQNQNRTQPTPPSPKTNKPAPQPRQPTNPDANPNPNPHNPPTPSPLQVQNIRRPHAQRRHLNRRHQRLQLRHAPLGGQKDPRAAPLGGPREVHGCEGCPCGW